MVPITLDFVADILCPWCAIARHRLDEACATLAATGLVVAWVWRPYLLDPGMPAGGMPQQLHVIRRFGSLGAADRYHKGVAEAGRSVGIDFRYDRIGRTPSAVDAHRLLLSVDGGAAQTRLSEALAAAFFTEGLDIGDRTVLTELAASTGMDGGAVRAMLDSDGFTAEVHASDRAAKRAGIAAVPAFCLHGRILSVPDPALLHDGIARAHMTLSGALHQPLEAARRNSGTSE